MKDPTVDRIPPLEIDLDFFDRDGKVVIPVPSPPVLIEIAEGASSRRPAAGIEITQIVDARELAASRRLKMDVVATARGLVPDLEELLELSNQGETRVADAIVTVLCRSDARVLSALGPLLKFVATRTTRSRR